MSQLETTLTQSVTASNPDTNKAFRLKYEEVLNVLNKCKSNFVRPTQKSILGEMKALSRIGIGLSSRIQEIISENSATQADLLDQFKKLRAEIVEFSKTLTSLKENMAKVGVSISLLEKGTFEVGIIFPPSDNRRGVGDFKEHVSNIEFIILTFQEMSGMSLASATIRRISSSDWEVFVACSGPAAAGIAFALERIVSMYKTYLEIKLLKKQLAEKEVPESVLKGLADHLDSKIGADVDSISKIIIDKYCSIKDSGRKSELHNKLRIALTKLIKMVDMAAIIDVVGNPPDKPSAPEGGAQDTPEQRQLSEQYTQTLELLEVVEKHGHVISDLGERSKAQLELPDPDCAPNAPTETPADTNPNPP